MNIIFKRISHLFLILLISFVDNNCLYAQHRSIIENKDTLKAYLQSSQNDKFPDAPIVILYETVSTGYKEYSAYYNYEIAFKVYNAKHLGGLANVAIPKTASIKAANINASTYNLENDSIIEHRLGRPDVNSSKHDNDVTLLRFSLPAVKDGSIVAYSFSLPNGGWLSRWCFQKEFPVLFSKYSARADNTVFKYLTEETTVPFVRFENEAALDASNTEAGFTEVEKTFSVLSTRIWVRRNIPPKADMNEKFAAPKDIKSECVSINSRDTYKPEIKGDWNFYNKRVWFGGAYAEVFAENRFLDTVMPKIVGNVTDTLEKAAKIFKYMQDSFSVGRKERKVDRDRNRLDLKQIYDSKGGIASELNALLCAMYRHQGIYSDVLLISNNSKKKLNKDAPNIFDINRVALRIIVKNNTFFADASLKNHPFGFLPLSYYNGPTWAVNKDGEWIDLSNKYAVDLSNTTIKILPDKNNTSKYKIKVTRESGVYSGFTLKSDWKKDSAAVINTFSKRVSEISKNAEFENIVVKMENTNETFKKAKIVIEADCIFSTTDDLLVIDPYFVKIFNGRNPFEDQDKRQNDIEFGNLSFEQFNFALQVDSSLSIDDYPMTDSISYGDPIVSKIEQGITNNPEKGLFLLNYKYELAPNNVPAANFQDIKEHFTNLSKLFNQKVILKRNK